MSKVTTTSTVKAIRAAAKAAGFKIGRISISDRDAYGLIDNSTKVWSGRIQLHWCKGSIESLQRYLENTNVVLVGRPCADGYASVSVNFA